MAKAREIPGLTTDLPYGEVAARVLEVRVIELIEHSAGVLDMNEIEGVHAMRVASRRLRAAIEIFRPCFPKAEGRRALNVVKALADALGERRDRDVAIAALEEFAASLPAPDRPGIQSLVARFRVEQAEANAALEPFVDPARLQEIRELVLELAEYARAAGGSEPEGEGEPAAGGSEPEGEYARAAGGSEPEGEGEPAAAEGIGAEDDGAGEADPGGGDEPSDEKPGVGEQSGDAPADDLPGEAGALPPGRPPAVGGPPKPAPSSIRSWS